MKHLGKESSPSKGFMGLLPLNFARTKKTEPTTVSGPNRPTFAHPYLPRTIPLWPHYVSSPASYVTQAYIAYPTIDDAREGQLWPLCVVLSWRGAVAWWCRGVVALGRGGAGAWWQACPERQQNFDRWRAHQKEAVWLS